MLYALGALHAFEPLYDISEVAVTIFQPRRANISTWSVSVTDLHTWADTVVKPTAELAVQGGGEFCAGSWCRFCRLAPTCRARADMNLALAKLEFAPPAKLTDTEIAEVLGRLPELTSWAADVEAYALSLAVNQGKTWDGFKLVAGRSIRKYVDETKVAEAAQKAGFSDVWDRKLKTITALEKAMGKKTFTEVLGDLVVKPAGKPALVPTTDKRPALEVRSAASEFTPIKTQKTTTRESEES